MTMRDDFCILILTHGRPDNVLTLDTLARAGYTGKVFLVIDNEDKRAQEYFDRYGDMVRQFDKKAVDEWSDAGDNSHKRNTILWARNVSFDIAEQVGCRYFMQLDDDYVRFEFMFDHEFRPTHIQVTRAMDDVLNAMLDFYISTPVLSIAMAQQGDFNGGPQGQSNVRLLRKAMNSFLCSTDRPFTYMGKFNEDVSTYVTRSLRGQLFFTVMQVSLSQKQTQSQSGGITEAYLESGTYVKAFMTVMHAPSCVKVGEFGDNRSDKHRIHHRINWEYCAPKILHEKHRNTAHG